MAKFDPVKMQDLVKVEDPDASGGVTLVFKGGQRMSVRAVGDRLESEVAGA